MAPTIRKEVQTYASVSERLLSEGWNPELTQDEKDLIAYYAQEVNLKFKAFTYAQPDLACP